MSELQKGHCEHGTLSILRCRDCEIQSLTAERDKYREALEEIIGSAGCGYENEDAALQAAQQALSETSGEGE